MIRILITQHTIFRLLKFIVEHINKLIKLRRNLKKLTQHLLLSLISKHQCYVLCLCE